MRWVFMVSVIILFLFLIAFGVQSVFGFEYFKTMGTMYAIYPTYCIMEPNPETEPRYQYLTEIAKNSIDEWNTKLSETTDGNWNMYYQSYAYDQHKDRTTDDYGQCGGFINFTAEPSQDGVLGSASANLEKGFYWINVQTQISNQKITINLGGNWEDRVETIVIEGDIPLNDIRNVLLHEIGHSLGVEHYYCESQVEGCANKSIMYPTVDIMIGKNRVVEQVDIDMVVRIYGEDGFLGWSNPVPELCLISSSGKLC
jgi:hypothetical protein